MSYYGNRRYNPPAEVYEASTLVGLHTGKRTEAPSRVARREYVTEQSGARWIVIETGVIGERAFWATLLEGCSLAKPGVVGFFAPSLAAACDALNN